MATPDRSELPAVLTLEECADELRVSVRTVRRMEQRGDLIAFKLGERPNQPLRILQLSVRDFITQQTRARFDERQARRRGLSGGAPPRA
jgi:Helix-turn-helix domain